MEESQKIKPVSSADEPAAKAAPSLYEKNKLRIAGVLNGFGDIALLKDGYTDEFDDKTKRKVDKTHLKVSGWLYTLGAAVITFFGSVNKDQQVKDLSYRTAEFMKQKTGSLTNDLQSSKILNRESGVMAKMARGLRRHSAQAMLWCYTLGAGAMLAGGIKAYRKPGGDKPISEILVGGMSLLVKAASMLLPEKSTTTDPEQSRIKETGIIGWIKEKPMRLFGYGSMLTEAFWGYRAYEKKKAGKDWKLAAATGGAYAASDVVIATTNKDATNAMGRLDQQEQGDLENMIAETIAHQSAEKQEALSQEAATFLEKEAAVSGNVDELRQSIMQRVEKLQDKAWVDRKVEEPAMELQV
ncbi:MAG: hypothetical protein P8P30_05235 [Rickettsiales bacterium]|nr:hypothetical protein [Rickettsiales bacterium]